MRLLLAAATALLVLMLELAGEADAATSDLARIFQFEMLNARLVYLESITGPAMHIYAKGAGVQARQYRVEGCRLMAYVKGGLVQAYGLALSPQCNFKLDDFLGNDYPSTDALTIGGFAHGAFGANLRAQATCIYLCSNAADPTVDFTWEGPHAANFLSVVLTVVLASDAAVGASERWAEVMRKTENDDYIDKAKFNCEKKYDASAIAAFNDVKVDEITIGYYQPNARVYAGSCSKARASGTKPQRGR